MNRKLVLMLTLTLLIGTLSVALNVQRAKAIGTIYIRVDGSIDPPDTPISTVDNVTYTLTGSIASDADGIVVERDSIMVDGQGYTVQGTGNGTGITLSGRGNVIIKNTEITTFDFGILAYSSSHNDSINGNNITNSGAGIYISYSTGNTVTGNRVTNNVNGIYLASSSNNNTISDNNITANNYTGIYLVSSSSYNTVSGNRVTNNVNGIYLVSSSGNTVTSNSVANNRDGIVLLSSSKNTVYHNNFVNNTIQTDFFGGSVNVWDDGGRGNYWSDYNGTDANHDCIGDTPYVIDANNTDRFPLMGTFQSFNVSAWNISAQMFEEVDVISNITISSLDLRGWLTSPNQYLQAGQLFLALMPVQGQNMSAGFCRITLPNNILNASYYTVLIDLTAINVSKLAISNDTYTTLYFTFNSSALDGIMIVPEFPTFLVLPLFFIATLLAVIVFRRKTAKLSSTFVS